jgi:hypothetical protein
MQTNEKGRRPGKTPTPMQTGSQCHGFADAPQCRAMTERQRRLAELLLSGPASRERLDRHVGCSNGPDEVRRFKKKYGVEILCDDAEGIDRDGHKITHGVYRLADADSEKVQALLREVHP